MTERPRAASLGHVEGSRRPVPLAESALLEERHSGRLLDIGCGRGHALERFGAYGFRAVGLEIGPEVLREAASRGEAVGGTADRLPFSSGTFDVVVILQVLHHVDDPVAVLSEIRRVLRPDGRLLLWETTEDSLFVRLGRTLRPQWEGVPVRARYRTNQLRAWLLQAGLAPLKELRWGTLLVGASAIGQLAPPLRRIVGLLWGLDVMLGRTVPISRGFYSCLAGIVPLSDDA